MILSSVQLCSLNLLISDVICTGRANEESLVARKMQQDEGSILENYDRFSNPEDNVKWKNLSPKQSQTGDGQTISLMGPQQLNMIAENPSGT